MQGDGGVVQLLAARLLTARAGVDGVALAQLRNLHTMCEPVTSGLGTTVAQYQTPHHAPATSPRTPQSRRRHQKDLL